MLAKHIRDLYDGGNWTSVCMSETLRDIPIGQALARSGDAHTIAELLYHIDYYVSTVLGVLEGGPLEAHDRFSFDLKVPADESEWRGQVEQVLHRGHALADAVEGMDPVQLEGDFAEPKYGTWHRNILGVIEHTHYHLGQITLLKRLMAEGTPR
jgi:hypothetical protein